ncbi:MAG: MFS transporter, partial [bacterium]
YHLLTSNAVVQIIGTSIDRAIAMGMWGGVAGAASAIGPILGGYLTTHYSWRWGFRINVFVAIVLIIGSIIIKECRDKEERPTLDILGVLLSSTGMLAFVFGIIESSTYGWWKAKETFIFFQNAIDLGGYSIVPISMMIGAMLLMLFVLWELKMARNNQTPLVSMNLFKNSQFTSSIMVTAIMALSQAGLIFSMPVFFQSVRGLDAFHTGLAFLPMSIAALITAPLAAAVLSRKIAPKYLIQAGFIISLIAFALVYRALNVNSNTNDFIPGMLFYGVGIGLMMAQLNNMALSAVSVSEAGEASGVNNTLRQVGSTLGSAIIGAALLTALSTNLVKGIEKSVVIPEQARAQISTQVSTQTSNVEFGGGAKVSEKISPQISAEIVKISHQATVDSSRLAVVYTIIFTFLGLPASFFLPKSKNIEREQLAAVKH